jgi:2-oxoglutarate dehydrogenase E1 component
MQVVNLTTPANFFHVLRRQLHRKFRKPLIVLTPKSLLRHPKCKSEIHEFVEEKFKEVIDDHDADPEKVTKLIFCSGKIYYELIEEREKTNDHSIAFIRIEQLYPFPAKKVDNIIVKYSKAKTILWVQEEPVNMGAWPFIRNTLKEHSVKVIGRPPSGSPATGSSKFHEIRQRKIIDKTFELCHCPLVGKECQTVCIGNRWRSFEKELEKSKTEIISTSISAEKKLK